MTKLTPNITIENKIYIIRGKRVMLDRDLSELYGVQTKRLNEQLKRNIKRFPDDFMFQLSKKEKDELVAICDRFESLKHSSVTPFAFTEQGIAMLSGVLNSTRAIIVNILIMRTFVKMRELMIEHRDLRKKIEQMENKYDYQFKAVFEAIKRLIEPPLKTKKSIGFHKLKGQPSG